MKKNFLFFILILFSVMARSNEIVWSNYLNILKENGGLDKNQEIRFEFPWRKDKELLQKLDQWTQTLLSSKQISKIIHITTTATSRISVEIYAVKDTQLNQLSGFIIKKNWKGVFGDEFSYKIIPKNYLLTPKPLGKIEQYEIGFIESLDLTKYFKLQIPVQLGGSKLESIQFLPEDFNLSKCVHLNLVVENSKLIKIESRLQAH